MRTLEWYRFMGFPYGLSDHSLGYVAPVMAVTMGACMIEKHFTLSRADGGPDAAHSLEPAEFQDMVWACRTAAKARGERKFGPKPCEETSYQYRRSIWLVKDIEKGEVLTSNHLAILRPNYGVEPRYLEQLIGERVKCNLEANTPMKWEYVG